MMFPLYFNFLFLNFSKNVSKSKPLYISHISNNFTINLFLKKSINLIIYRNGILFLKIFKKFKFNKFMKTWRFRFFRFLFYFKFFKIGFSFFNFNYLNFSNNKSLFVDYKNIVNLISLKKIYFNIFDKYLNFSKIKKYQLNKKLMCLKLLINKMYFLRGIYGHFVVKKNENIDYFQLIFKIKKNNLFLNFMSIKTGQVLFFLTAGRLTYGKKKTSTLTIKNLTRILIRLIYKYFLLYKRIKENKNKLIRILFKINILLYTPLIKTILFTIKQYKLPLYCLIDDIKIPHSLGCKKRKIRRV